MKYISLHFDSSLDLALVIQWDAYVEVHSSLKKN